MGLKTFINNIRYLARYNIKNMQKAVNKRIDRNSIIKILHLLPYIENTNSKRTNILNVEETINLLINTNKSIIRYGDGEFTIMGGVFYFKHIISN